MSAASQFAAPPFQGLPVEGAVRAGGRIKTIIPPHLPTQALPREERPSYSRATGEQFLFRTWTEPARALAQLESEVRMQDFKDVRAGAADMCIDPRSGHLQLRGEGLQYELTHHGLVQLLGRLSTPGPAHVARFLRDQPAWGRAYAFESNLEARGFPEGWCVVRIANGRVRAAPGAAYFHDGLLDDLPVAKVIFPKGQAVRWSKDFLRSRMEVMVGSSRCPEASELVTVTNSEVGFSSLHVFSSLRIQVPALDVTVDGRSRGDVVVADEVNGSSRRHTLPAKDKERIAAERIEESFRVARAGFEGLVAAWEKAKTDFPAGSDGDFLRTLSPGEVTGDGDQGGARAQLVDVLLDAAEEKGRMPEKWDRAAYKAALLGANMLSGIPFGSAAHMAALVALIGHERAKTEDSGAEANAATTWLYEGWRK